MAVLVVVAGVPDNQAMAAVAAVARIPTVMMHSPVHGMTLSSAVVEVVVEVALHLHVAAAVAAMAVVHFEQVEPPSRWMAQSPVTEVTADQGLSLEPAAAVMAVVALVALSELTARRSPGQVAYLPMVPHLATVAVADVSVSTPLFSHTR